MLPNYLVVFISWKHLQLDLLLISFAFSIWIPFWLQRKTCVPSLPFAINRVWKLQFLIDDKLLVGLWRAKKVHEWISNYVEYWISSRWLLSRWVRLWRSLFTLNFKLPLGTLLLLKASDSFENHLQFLRNKQMREILRRFNFLADWLICF